MKVGYLHVGRGGVQRYGRMFAAEAKRRSNLEVIESEVALGEGAAANRATLIEAAKNLSAADVVHFQYNKKVWGGGQAHLRHLRAFISHCHAPLTVTLHDVYLDPRDLRPPEPVRPGLVRSLVRFAKAFIDPTRAAIHDLSDRVRLCFVSSREEARRLEGSGLGERVEVVRHFVEEREVTETPREARVALGLEGRRVVTLLGFIHPRKGHGLVLAALPQLPADVTVLFAGGATLGGDRYVERVKEQARDAIAADRLRVTGFLSEEDLQRAVLATHLAVCPFEALSASGSLSTWISVGRPILASDLPQIGEYEELEPGAVQTFRPYTAEALAAAVTARLEECTGGEDPRVMRLAERLSMPRIFDEHEAHYRVVARAGEAGGDGE